MHSAGSMEFALFRFVRYIRTLNAPQSPSLPDEATESTIHCAKAETSRRLVHPSTTLPQPGAADTGHSEGTRAAASSGLSRVGRVGGVVGMLGV